MDVLYIPCSGICKVFGKGWVTTGRCQKHDEIDPMNPTLESRIERRPRPFDSPSPQIFRSVPYSKASARWDPWKRSLNTSSLKLVGKLLCFGSADFTHVIRAPIVLHGKCRKTMVESSPEATKHAARQAWTYPQGLQWNRRNFSKWKMYSHNFYCGKFVSVTQSQQRQRLQRFWWRTRARMSDCS